MRLSIRSLCLWVHRYTGLLMAGFLIVASLTGTLLVFYSELDDRFNHKLAYIDTQNIPQLPITILHDHVVSAYPEYTFSSMPTSIDPNKSAVFTVDNFRGNTKIEPKPLFQEVYVHPYTGNIIGTRDKEQWAWRNTMWQVFWLHRELLLGDIGKLILGIISLMWTINCFIGFYLTFPRAVSSNKDRLNKNKKVSSKKRTSFFKRWQPAWKIRTTTNLFKLNYDLHHAFGLWLWLMLFVMAWSSVGFNLKQVYQPVMQAVVGLESNKGKSSKQNTPPVSTAPSSRKDMSSEIETKDSADVVNKANSIAYLSMQADIIAQENHLQVQQLLGIRWVVADNQWQMRFKTDDDIGKKGGASSITVNAKTGRVERVHFGYQSSSFGTKADHWLSTLHMGHIGHDFGHRLYQIFLMLIGLAVMFLSATGVYLWWRGRQQRFKRVR